MREGDILNTFHRRTLDGPWTPARYVIEPGPWEVITCYGSVSGPGTYVRAMRRPDGLTASGLAYERDISQEGSDEEPAPALTVRRYEEGEEIDGYWVAEQDTYALLRDGEIVRGRLGNPYIFDTELMAVLVLADLEEEAQRAREWTERNA
jgi:hypothetical protein